MKFILKFAIILFTFIFLLKPFPTYAGSSSAVTGSNSLYNNGNFVGRDFSKENLQNFRIYKSKF